MYIQGKYKYTVTIYSKKSNSYAFLFSINKSVACSLQWGQLAKSFIHEADLIPNPGLNNRSKFYDVTKAVIEIHYISGLNNTYICSKTAVWNTTKIAYPLSLYLFILKDKD